jgi:calpain-7
MKTIDFPQAMWQPPCTDASKLTTREKIILLKASKHSPQCTFPPWTTEPSQEEFQGPAYEDPFEFRLSMAQQEDLSDWLRPSPSWQEWKSSLTGDLDLVQDATDDCSIVASISAACARSERLEQDHGTFLSAIMFPSARPSPNGKYIFRLNFNGCCRRVVTDDRLPSSVPQYSIHIKSRNRANVIWPALLEKAYLKVLGGYAFPGSNSGTDLWILLGWIPEQVHLKG